MSHFVLFDGKLINADAPVIEASNRGFRYGDGLFETMKCTDGQLEHALLHFERLFTGMEQLHFTRPSWMTASYFLEQIQALCHRNQQEKLTRIRLTIFRGNGSVTDPVDTHPHYLIETADLPGSVRQFNKTGLTIGLYDKARKAADGFSHIKSNNFQPYVQASIFARQQEWDDAIVLNTSGTVCDTTIANIFVVKQGRIFTPPLSAGCIAGVTRRVLLEQLPNHGFSVTEQDLSPGDVEAADEVFLTNSIYGLRWVKQCGGETHHNDLSLLIYQRFFQHPA